MDHLPLLSQQVLTGDSFYYIADQLSPQDLYYLAKTCQYYQKELEELFKRKIMNTINIRLSDFLGKNLKEFKNEMKTTGSFISGSFILQCILNETWNNSDIDVYTPIEDNTDVRKGDHSKEHQPSGFTTLEYFLYMTLEHKNYESAGQTYDPLFRMDKISIERVLEYEKKEAPNKQILQVIEIWTKNNITELKEFVNSFDFDICKNFYYIDNENNENLYICNLSNIFNRITEFKYKESIFGLNSSIKRMKKYQDRGFKFSNLNTLNYEQLAFGTTVVDMTDPNIFFQMIYTFKIKTIDVTKNLYKILNNDDIKIINKAWATEYQYIIDNSNQTIQFIDKTHDHYITHHDKCNKECIVKFGNPKKQHIHQTGKLLGRMCWNSYIFVIED